MNKQQINQNSAFSKVSPTIDEKSVITTHFSSQSKVIKPVSLVVIEKEEPQLNKQPSFSNINEPKLRYDNHGNDHSYNSPANKNFIGHSIQEEEEDFLFGKKKKEKATLKKRVKKIQNEIDTLEKRLVELKRRKEEVKKDIEETDKECRALNQKNNEITQFKHELLRIEEQCDKIKAELRKPFVINKFK